MSTVSSDKAAFDALQKVAKSWRCWDRTESLHVEDRIVDGAAWGILYAIQQGEIPGIAFRDSNKFVDIIESAVMSELTALGIVATYAGDSGRELSELVCQSMESIRRRLDTFRLNGNE